MPVNGLGLPGGSASPTGRMPHERSRVAVYASGVTADRVTVDAQLALPGADAGEARGVEQDPIALPADVLGLGDRPVLGAVHEVEADAVLVGVADDAQLAERLAHLDAIGPDLLRHLVVGTRARSADCPLAIAAAHSGVRVDHAEVRIHAEPVMKYASAS